MRIRKILAALFSAGLIVTSAVILPVGANLSAQVDEVYASDLAQSGGVSAPHGAAAKLAAKDENGKDGLVIGEKGKDGSTLLGVIENKKDEIRPTAINKTYEVLTPEIMDEIEACVENFSTELDLYEYGISIDDYSKFTSDIFLWASNHSRYFYFGTISVWSNSGSGIITKIEFNYSYEEDVAMSRLKQIDDAVADAYSYIKSGMTDYQKALVMHDWLAYRTAYAYDRLQENANTKDDFNAYGALVIQEAVCQGYAEAYSILMQRCGIECYVVTSAALNHAWNVVKIGGQYYNVDVTWDDPVYDQLGRVRHIYLLVDNATMKSRASTYGGTVHTGPEDFDASKLTSKTYASAKWVDVTSPISYYGGKYYYAKEVGSSIKLYYTTNISTAEGTTFYTLPAKWPYAGGGTWNGNYCRPFVFGNYLIFNTSSSILYFNLNNLTSTPTTMYAASAIPGVNTSNATSLYGFKVDDKVIRYVVNNTPNFESTPTIKTLNNTLKSVVGNTPTPSPTKMARPKTPKNIKAELVSATSVKVSWSKAQGAEGYQVLRAFSSSGDYTALGSVSTTSRTSTGLYSGTNYYFKVRSYMIVDGKRVYSPLSDVAQIKVPSKPFAPDTIGAHGYSATAIKVEWYPSYDAEGYQVWRATSASGPFTAVGSVTTTNRICTGLKAGMTYYFKVRGYKDVSGIRIYGDFSSVTSASPISVSTPSGIKAEIASGTSVNVSWNSVSPASGYQVWRATSADGPFTALGSVSTTNRVCTGLKYGSTYYFKVRAFVNNGSTKIYSPYTSVISITLKLASPSGVKAAVSSATAVTVSWNKVAGATGYEVYRCETSNGTYVKLGSLTETSRKCPGLTSGKTYYFKVRAYTTVNGSKVYSNYSSVVSATPKK